MGVTFCAIARLGQICRLWRLSPLARGACLSILRNIDLDRSLLPMATLPSLAYFADPIHSTGHTYAGPATGAAHALFWLPGSPREMRRPPPLGRDTSSVRPAGVEMLGSHWRRVIA